MGGYPHLMNASVNDPSQRIESLTNPLVKELRELRTHKGRVEQRRFLAEGERSLAEAVAAAWRAELLLIAPGAARGVVPAARTIDVTDEVLAKITGRDNPQAHLGVFAEPDAASRDLGALNARSAARWLMIEAPRDPGNLGSCIRSADATAAGGIILVGDACDPYSIECVRATMGSIFAVPIYRVTRDEAVALLARWPGESVATAADGSVDYTEIGFKSPAMLVIGTEADGLSSPLRSACTRVARLPMLGRAESVNLAVAAGVFLYAAERAQR
jgi:TrmH family RNA methyltransferase